MTKNITLIVLIKIVVVYGLTCEEILELPSDQKLSLNDLQTMPPKDVVQCLAHLAKEEMATEEAVFIWHTIIKFHEGISNIPESVLMLLHWATVAIPPEEYENITFSSIDIIQNFGLNYHLSEEQLTAIAKRVREDFAEKEPEEYTYYDLTALRQILCAFNRSEIERIRPSAYKEAAILIGKLEHCNADVMLGFANVAVQTRAFGPPENWTDGIIKLIGKVAEYVAREPASKLHIASVTEQ